MVNNVFAFYAKTAKQALYEEVALTPKPGLVDQCNNGAHHDMSFDTFQKSIDALFPYFEAYLHAGYTDKTNDSRQLFERLRQIGIAAEKSMFTATNQVNTHKGANFLFALVLGATGKFLASLPPEKQIGYIFSRENSQRIAAIVSELTQHLIATDFANLDTKKTLSYGEKLFIQHGILGPRGEAVKGLPCVMSSALPFIQKRQSESQNHRLIPLETLIYLMSFVEDGNIIHRGGITAWQTIKQECAELLHLINTPDDFITAVTAYDTLLTNRHLSPGGAADLLAITLYFSFLEQLLTPQHS